MIKFLILICLLLLIVEMFRGIRDHDDDDDSGGEAHV